MRRRPATVTLATVEELRVNIGGRGVPGRWTVDEHEAYVAALCLGDAWTVGTCGAFVDAGLSAVRIVCLFGFNDSPASGPITSGPIPAPELSGCIEFADPSVVGQACAAVVLTDDNCIDYACQPNCPVTDDFSRAAYVACTNAATVIACPLARRCTHREPTWLPR